jgi:hypothetical protein
MAKDSKSEKTQNTQNFVKIRSTWLCKNFPGYSTKKVFTSLWSLGGAKYSAIGSMSARSS